MGKKKPPRYRPVRTPTVLQMEATECGAASLGIILGYHGRYVPLEELRVECRVSRDGSNSLLVKKTAESHGLVSKGFKMSVDGLKALKPPFVVHWELNHFLVVEGFSFGRVFLNDPAVGRRVVDEKSFRKSYTGLVFTHVPGPDFLKGGAPPSTWAAIFRRMDGARRAIAYVVLAGVALMACDMIAASYNLIFVDQVLVEERWTWVRPLLLAMGVTVGFQTLAGMLQQDALRRLKLSLAVSHSAKFLWHVLRLPVAFYQQRFAGEVAGRVDGNSIVADLVSGPLATTMVGLLMVVFYASMMFAYDPILTLLGVAIGSLNLAGIGLAGRLIAEENQKIKQVRGRLYGAMVRAIQVIETVKAGSLEAETLVRLTGNQARATNASQVVGVVTALLIALPPLLLLLTTAAVLWFGGLRVMDGLMSVGGLLAFQTLMANFNRPFGDLVRLGSSAHMLQAELSRLDDVYQNPCDPVFGASGSGKTTLPPPLPPYKEGDSTYSTMGRSLRAADFAAVVSKPRNPPRRLSGHLVLENVSFGYNLGASEPLIRNFSLEVVPGSRVAIVGTSGSGKSTIGRLVAGLYRPWEGKILFDGFTIDQIPRAVFTSQVAMVDDQNFLFTGSVRDNLTLWDDTILDRELIRASIDANVHGDIIRRRGAYGATIAEGARNLSGGQRQRLEIARALARNPSLLILDEATSALDPVTEARVDDNLRRRGCTCLIIAHRLSTIRDCDEIIVLRQGRVIQRGDHHKLMADTKGFYYELQTLAAEPDPTVKRPTAVALSAPSTNGSSTNGHPGPRAEPSPVPAEMGAVAETGAADAGAAVAVGENNVPAVSVDPPAQPETADGRLSFSPDTLVAPSANGSAEERELTAEDSARLAREAAKPAEEELPGLLHALEPFAVNVMTAGNHPLPLDDSGAVWRVVSGKVDLFYVQPDSNRMRGTRRHLCRVEEGGSIFAVEGVRGMGDGHFLAVGVGTAELKKFPKANLMRLSFEPAWRDDVADMIDDWVDHISRAIDPEETPPPMARLEPDTAATIAAGGQARARSRVMWVPDQPGLSFFGRVPVPVCPFGSRFPLSSHAWLKFTQEVEVTAWGTEKLMENGDAWVGLKRFHGVVLDALAQARMLERAVRHARLESSTLRDEKTVTASLAGLAALAAPESDTPTTSGVGSPLFDACRAVAAALGAEVVDQHQGIQGESVHSICRASGLQYRQVSLGLEWWGYDGGPMLAFLTEENKPVALLPGRGGKYSMFDPSRGVTVPMDEAVASKLAPQAYVFYKTLPGERVTPGDLARFCYPMLRKDLRSLVVLGLVCGLLGVAAPTVLGVVIDDAIPRADRDQLRLLCAFLVAIGIAAAVFQSIQGLALVRIKGRLEASLLPAVWDRLLALPARFFSSYESGDLAMRAMGLARLIELAAGTTVASVLVGFVSLLNVLVLFWVNWRLALGTTALLAAVPLATYLTVKPLLHYQRAITRTQGRISGLLLLLLSGISRIRVAGAERRAFARWAELYRQQLDLTIRMQRVSDRLTVFTDVWPLFVLMAVFATASLLGPGVLSTGDFLAFNLALGLGMAALIGLGRALVPLINGLDQFERFRPILETAPEAAESRGEAVTLGGAIRLTNVSFRYEPDGPLVLDNVSLQVRPGEFVALVGPSGSGKSTLMRLLLGFETPTDGVVAYDGRELATLDVQEVRRQLGVVLQDAQLFPGDIFSNIVGLTSGKTRKEAREAAELAGLADDLANMPMGLHTVIGEGGAGLSSGQRQRLIIARALAGKPRVLLLDEATSALDNRTQAHVSKSIHSRLQGTTRIAIAHRVSTIVEADRIYVIVDGKIAQAGRYRQLMDEPGPFRELARRQALD